MSNVADEFDGYVTKYALTAGIERRRLRVTSSVPTMAEVVPQGQWSEYYHQEGRDWHRTYASAIKAAEGMRLRKIKSLKKSLAAMEALTFSDPTT